MTSCRHVTQSLITTLITTLPYACHISERPPQIIKAFHHQVVIALCKHLRVPLADVLAQDLSVQRPRNEAWLQAARINRMGIYVIAVELMLGNAELARALGCTRQNVKQARDDVEDWREAERKIERAITAVSASVMRAPQ